MKFEVRIVCGCGEGSVLGGAGVPSLANLAEPPARVRHCQGNWAALLLPLHHARPSKQREGKKETETERKREKERERKTERDQKSAWVDIVDKIARASTGCGGEGTPASATRWGIGGTGDAGVCARHGNVTSSLGGQEECARQVG